MIKQPTSEPASESAATPEGSRPKPTGATELGEQIGSELRKMFDGVMAEPVPEKFRHLLEQLERKSSEP